jgi:PhnB protein
MKADLSVYISFDGQARQALTYYQSAIGGKLDLETFGMHAMATSPADEEKILYGVLRNEQGFVIRGTDRPLQDGPSEKGTAFAVCLNGEEHDLLTGCWEGLATKGTTVIQPLRETPWGDLNGVLRDPYGILWIFNIGSSE